MVAAHGDLQRLLSTFFARPISISRVWANTGPRLQPASKDAPIKQTRQVKLVCEGRTVCIATSSVSISNPTVERLFLNEKYAIGQCYRKMNQECEFALLEVVTGTSRDGKRMLRRRYTLHGGGLDCDIVELFPDRDMFLRGTDWLYDVASAASSDVEDIEAVDSDDSETAAQTTCAPVRFTVASSPPPYGRARVQLFFVIAVLALLSVL